jgi:FkbM family methyltransferase
VPAFSVRVRDVSGAGDTSSRLSVLVSLGRYAGAFLRATVSGKGRLGPFSIELPGPLKFRVSIVAGNMRMHRLIDRTVRAGDTFVDVGANIGYNTLYAVQRVGRTGRVVAIEPASDNVALLRRQLAANGVRNVTVRDAAAGRTTEQRDLYLRGEVSAVNSLFPDSCFGPVTGVGDPYQARRRAHGMTGDADVVKIDVEGAELDVLRGMSRLLRAKPVRLIVEWHPALQVAADTRPTLPRWLLDRGFSPRSRGTHRSNP